MTVSDMEALEAESPAGTRRRVVLVTGLSGAGLSTALKALEDMGYEAVDNLPMFLLDALIRQARIGRKPLAVGIDSRTRGFTAQALLDEIAGLEAGDRTGEPTEVRLVFMDADDDVLQRRFTETRRRHPMAIDRPVADGIHRERELLAPLRDFIDVMIDTSALSNPELRRILAGHFRLDAAPGLSIFVTSFSFRRGVPREADLIFDVRFLTNPHYDPTLRPLTGRDPPVADKVASDPDFPQFFERLTALLDPLLPRYRQEGKSYLTIGIGCTGGRHRSVYVAERLSAWLQGKGVSVGLSHRDLERPEPRP